MAGSRASKSRPFPRRMLTLFLLIQHPRCALIHLSLKQQPVGNNLPRIQASTQVPCSLLPSRAISQLHSPLTPVSPPVPLAVRRWVPKRDRCKCCHRVEESDLTKETKVETPTSSVRALRVNHPDPALPLLSHLASTKMGLMQGVRSPERRVDNAREASHRHR